MSNQQQVIDLKASWDALAAGDLDKLTNYYAEEMIFVLPGQNDILEGKAAFRSALDNIGEALPPGFDITEIRYCPGDDEIVNVLQFTADKIPDGSQCAVLFRFNGEGKVNEERWFVDTEQWKQAF